MMFDILSARTLWTACGHGQPAIACSAFRLIIMMFDILSARTLWTACGHGQLACSACCSR